MDVQFQIEETPDYLAVRFTGATKEVWRQFDLIAERCNRANKNKLLLDITQTHGEFSLADRYYSGEKAETFIFHSLIKVAVVSRPEQLDWQKFAETVARNRLVNGRVFTNVRAAKRWLLMKSVAPRKRKPRAIIIPQNPADHSHH
jgi:hypothetical protein